MGSEDDAIKALRALHKGLDEEYRYLWHSEGHDVSMETLNAVSNAIERAIRTLLEDEEN